MKNNKLVLIVIVAATVVLALFLGGFYYYAYYLPEKELQESGLPLYEIEAFEKYEDESDIHVGRFEYTDAGFGQERMGFASVKPPVALIPNNSENTLNLFYVSAPSEVQKVILDPIEARSVGEIVFEEKGRYVIRSVDSPTHEFIVDYAGESVPEDGVQSAIFDPGFAADINRYSHTGFEKGDIELVSKGSGMIVIYNADPEREMTIVAESPENGLVATHPPVAAGERLEVPLEVHGQYVIYDKENTEDVRFNVNFHTP